MKKQTVDVFEKGENNLPFHKAISQSDKDTIATISAQIFIDDIAEQSEYERQFWILSDKLWTKITYGVGIFILGYGVYHFIRFLMM